MREIRTLPATWRGLETWHGRDSGTQTKERDNREPKLRPAPVLDPTDERDVETEPWSNQ